MRVWAHTMKRITSTSLQLQPPENIELYFADTRAGKLFSDQCRQGELVPFIRGGLLPAVISCQDTKRVRPEYESKKQES